MCMKMMNNGYGGDFKKINIFFYLRRHAQASISIVCDEGVYKQNVE